MVYLRKCLMVEPSEIELWRTNHVDKNGNFVNDKAKETYMKKMIERFNQYMYKELISIINAENESNKEKIQSLTTKVERSNQFMRKFPEFGQSCVVLLICVTKVAKSAFDKALAEHEDIDDDVGSE
ncbi:hypothetical protein OROHE_006815 [Orobanche hederae]